MVVKCCSRFNFSIRSYIKFRIAIYVGSLAQIAQTPTRLAQYIPNYAKSFWGKRIMKERTGLSFLRQPNQGRSIGRTIPQAQSGPYMKGGSYMKGRGGNWICVCPWRSLSRSFLPHNPIEFIKSESWKKKAEDRARLIFEDEWETGPRAEKFFGIRGLDVMLSELGEARKTSQGDSSVEYPVFLVSLRSLRPAETSRPRNIQI